VVSLPVRPARPGAHRSPGAAKSGPRARFPAPDREGRPWASQGLRTPGENVRVWPTSRSRSQRQGQDHALGALPQPQDGEGQGPMASASCPAGCMKSKTSVRRDRLAGIIKEGSHRRASSGLTAGWMTAPPLPHGLIAGARSPLHSAAQARIDRPLNKRRASHPLPQAAFKLASFLRHARLNCFCST
jgi:hypothetical protein